MKEYYKIYVYEDNAGGLHLVVFNNEATPVFYRAGYERYDGFLSADIDALMHGDSPATWESNYVDDLDFHYLEWECELIADGDTDKGMSYYYIDMGRSGLREFGGTEI